MLMRGGWVSDTMTKMVVVDERVVVIMSNDGHHTAKNNASKIERERTVGWRDQHRQDREIRGSGNGVSDFQERGREGGKVRERGSVSMWREREARGNGVCPSWTQFCGRLTGRTRRTQKLETIAHRQRTFWGKFPETRWSCHRERVLVFPVVRLTEDQTQFSLAWWIWELRFSHACLLFGTAAWHSAHIILIETDNGTWHLKYFDMNLWCSLTEMDACGLSSPRTLSKRFKRIFVVFWCFLKLLWITWELKLLQIKKYYIMYGSEDSPQTDWGPVRWRTLVCFYVREFGAVITIIYIGWFLYWSIYRLLHICVPFFLSTRWARKGCFYVQTGQAQRFYACEPISDGVRVRTPDRLHAAVTDGRRGAATVRLSHRQPRGKYFTRKPFVCVVSARFSASLMRLIGSESLQNPDLIASIYYASL